MDNNKETNLIRSILTTEVKYILGIIIFVAGVVAPYYGIRQDVALIKQDINIINTNHESHIQDIVQQQKEMSAQILELQKQLIIITRK